VASETAGAQELGIMRKRRRLDIFKVAEKKVLDMLAEKHDKLLSAEIEHEIDEMVRKAQNDESNLF
jgi:hypothetical protein